MGNLGPEERFSLEPVLDADSGQRIPFGVMILAVIVVAGFAVAFLVSAVVHNPRTIYQVLGVPLGLAWVAVMVWGAWLVWTPQPDRFVVDQVGWRAQSHGRLVREGRWDDPNLDFKILDWRENASVAARARTDAKLRGRLIVTAATGYGRVSQRAFFLTPEAFDGLLRVARVAGLAVTSTPKSMGPRQDGYAETQVSAAPRTTRSTRDPASRT
ncbi:MAG: hypothetical protein L3J96_02320 [Thermoplasmata archaeon]|nr:hypothetical protein [Thermoplasmata archaeon]